MEEEEKSDDGDRVKSRLVPGMKSQRWPLGRRRVCLPVGTNTHTPAGRQRDSVTKVSRGFPEAGRKRAALIRSSSTLLAQTFPRVPGLFSRRSAPIILDAVEIFSLLFRRFPYLRRLRLRLGSNPTSNDVPEKIGVDLLSRLTAGNQLVDDLQRLVSKS